MALTNVSDLNGAALDWAIAQSEGLPVRHDPMGFKTGSEAGYWLWEEVGNRLGKTGLIGRDYSPSSKWGQAGPIIEKLRKFSQHQFLIESDGENVHVLSWPSEHVFFRGCGATTLEAVMRCYVESKMGETIKIPSLL